MTTADERAELEAILGYSFIHPEWLERALTHRSHRQGAEDIDNERLGVSRRSRAGVWSPANIFA